MINLSFIFTVASVTTLLTLVMIALCCYFWVSQKQYPCAWSATSDAKSDVYYKKRNSHIWKGAAAEAEGTPHVPEDLLSTANKEPLLSSIVLSPEETAATSGKDENRTDMSTAGVPVPETPDQSLTTAL